VCLCFNERDHTLTTVSIVPVHWQPEMGTVREYNHFPYIQVYVLVHGYRRIFRGGLQLINHSIILISLHYLKTFKLLDLNLINVNPN
jgi:hypothetical protein